MPRVRMCRARSGGIRGISTALSLTHDSIGAETRAIPYASITSLLLCFGVNGSIAAPLSAQIRRL